MIEIKDIICITCPTGCRLRVTVEDGTAVKVEGNTCRRGEQYGKTEATAPVRTVTTTVRLSDGTMLPVKTANPVAKAKMFDIIRAAAEVRPSLPINPGQVIVKDIAGTNIVACAGRE